MRNARALVEHAHGRMQSARSRTNVRLFSTSGRNDFLVVYDEYSGHAAPQALAPIGWSKNDKRIAQDRRPLFVSPKSANQMTRCRCFRHCQMQATRRPRFTQSFQRNPGPLPFIVTKKSQRITCLSMTMGEHR